MKFHFISAIALVFAAMLHRGDAQGFNSGSTGANGALNVTEDTTLNLPPDGIFHFTTITVAGGRTLRFNKNSLNTPVYLLASGDVLIQGAIDISGTNANGGAPGRGGPGGFDGGFGGFGTGANSAGSDGLGPGAGVVNNDVYSGHRAAVFAYTRPDGNQRRYGNALLSPLIGGSGGAGHGGNPGYGGGGGGGAILIASNTKITLNGGIYSEGGRDGANWSGYGSGGAIRLVAPLVNGSGECRVSSDSWRDGRIRVDCQDRYSFRQIRYYGSASNGSQMFVFPPVMPRLSLVEAAGQAISEGTTSSVEITLPAGSSTNRIVKVRARDFTGIVPITVVVTPENSPSTRYDAQIDMSNGNPAEVSVNVAVRDGQLSRIQAWTR